MPTHLRRFLAVGLATAALLALAPGGAAAAATLKWSAPVSVDRLPPYANRVQINAISCLSESLCAAVDDAGGVTTSTNPGAASPTWAAADADRQDDDRRLLPVDVALRRRRRHDARRLRHRQPDGKRAELAQERDDPASLSAASPAPPCRLCVAVSDDQHHPRHEEPGR